MNISLGDSTRFWDTVKDCLVEIYRVPEQEARARVERLLRSTIRLESGLDSGERWLSELVYHHEPINLAGELARQPVPHTKKANDLYRMVVARHAPEGSESQVKVSDVAPEEDKVRRWRGLRARSGHREAGEQPFGGRGTDPAKNATVSFHNGKAVRIAFPDDGGTVRDGDRAEHQGRDRSLSLETRHE